MRRLSASVASKVMVLNCLFLFLGLLPNLGRSCLPPPSYPPTSSTPSPAPSSTESLLSTSGATQEEQQSRCILDTDHLGKNLGNCSVCTSSKGLPCQLPFLFDGQEFHSCTNHSDSRLWCATRLNHILPTLCFILGINRVDSEGRLLRGVEAWDYCPSPCPAAGKLQAQRC